MEGASDVKVFTVKCHLTLWCRQAADRRPKGGLGMMLHRPGGLQAQVCCKEKLLVQRSIPQGMPASAPNHHCIFWKQHSALLEGCSTSASDASGQPLCCTTLSGRCNTQPAVQEGGHEPCLQEGRCCYTPNVHIQGRQPERENLQHI
jgi:hypothetical protein